MTANNGIQAGRNFAADCLGRHKACQWLRSNIRSGGDLNNDARAVLREHNWDGTADPDETAEAIEDECREAPLSIEYRGRWNAGEKPRADEAVILLGTGGPALRLVVTMGPRGTEATLEGRDWLTPWETVSTSADEDEALEWFADLFYLEGLE